MLGSLNTCFSMDWLCFVVMKFGLTMLYCRSVQAAMGFISFIGRVTFSAIFILAAWQK